MHRINETWVAPLAVLTILLAPQFALAAEATRVASAFDHDDPFDAFVSVGYQRTLFRGAIRRERTGQTDDQTEIELAKELRFTQTRHLIYPRLDIGLWKDLEVYIEVPIVVSDSRGLDFEQNGGASCGDPPETNCVTRNNSTLVRDGLIDGDAMSDDQVAVGNADGPPGGLLLPDRSGIDQLNLGVIWAPWNQQRDPTKPTWLLGFESRIAVGTPMTYDPDNPEDDTSVGRGIHELHFFTTVSRRFPHFEPWFDLYYMLPIATPGSAFEKTRFPASGQSNAGPQHSAGATMGLEFVPWESADSEFKLTIAVSAHLAAIFAGRGYSPMWELLSQNPPLDGLCDPNPEDANSNDPPDWSNGSYCDSPDDLIPYPGISKIDDYLHMRGTLFFDLQLTHFAHLHLGLSLGHDQSHMITNELPGAPRERNAEIDATDPLQVNPMYRDLIDTPGNRFKVEETTIFDLFVAAVATF